ncbi:sigma-70 family RNA polymerase sigma factor [Synechocystis sp. LKSZ1]|uniref:sigma-70 family RNA polymerase sigma factor n=1 Tax=Synechocystis sp. LKSZ1 TaxID=3144951 RepID=UPI00336C067B
MPRPLATPYSAVRCLELFLRYRRNPSLGLRNQIVHLNIGLVRQVVHRFRGQTTEPYEDLEQVGYLGLLRAVERFNPQQGAAFSSFAVPFIRGEILHYLRDKALPLRIPRRYQELYTRAKKLRVPLGAQLGRCPSDADLAQALGISTAEWQDCILACQHRFPLSLDAPLANLPDATTTLADSLPDVNAQFRQQQEEEQACLRGAVEQLEGRTQAAIQSVFLRELPRKEAAKQIGISPMTVTRHLQKGLVQLEALLAAQTA